MDETLANNSPDTAELATQNAAPEQATDDIERPEGDQSSDADGGEHDAEPEVEEVDINGIKLAVAKAEAEKIRMAVMQQADYTRKTQELAQQREQAEASFAERQARIEAEQANIQSVARLVAIDERLQQYANVDWQSLSQSDPVTAQAQFFQFQQLKDARGALVGQIQQHEAQKALRERQSLQQAEETLAREIKGWSPETKKALADVARKLGASDQEIATIRAPWVIRALHAQKVLSELQQQASKPPAPAPAQPVRTITGAKAKADVDPDKLSVDEWMRRESARARKLGRRY